VSPPGREQPAALMEGEEPEESCPAETAEMQGYTCPLSVLGKCIAFSYRPIVCRVFDATGAGPYSDRLLEEKLHELSKSLFLELNSALLEGTMLFSLTNVVSGRFVQEYFHFITKPPAVKHILNSDLIPDYKSIDTGCTTMFKSSNTSASTHYSHPLIIRILIIWICFGFRASDFVFCRTNS
jgi:hypothetical protein